jgi:hypothetical protein
MKKPRNDGDFPFWRLWLIAQWILLAALLLFVVFTVSSPRQNLLP